MKLKKPIPDTNSWSISEIIQLGCGFVLAIALTIITNMLFYSTILIYSPSELEKLKGTHEYGRGAVLFGLIPSIIGVLMLPVNVLLWINAMSIFMFIVIDKYFISISTAS